MRKIGKILALSLVALGLISGLAVPVAAENTLVLGEATDIFLTVNDAGEIKETLIFDPIEVGTYYFYCNAAAPFKANNQVAKKEGSSFVVSYLYIKDAEGPSPQTLELTSTEPITVTVQVVKTAGTTASTGTDTSATGSDTEPTASVTQPSDSTVSQPTTSGGAALPGSSTASTTTTTTTTTTAISTQTTVSTTVPSVTNPTRTIPQATSSVSRFTYSSRSAATSIASPIGGARPNGTHLSDGFAGIANGGDRADRDDDSVGVGKVVLYSMLALAIMVGGGVAIYVISKPNNPKQH